MRIDMPDWDFEHSDCCILRIILKNYPDCVRSLAISGLALHDGCKGASQVR